MILNIIILDSLYTVQISKLVDVIANVIPLTQFIRHCKCNKYQNPTEILTVVITLDILDYI